MRDALPERERKNSGEDDAEGPWPGTRLRRAHRMGRHEGSWGATQVRHTSEAGSSTDRRGGVGEGCDVGGGGERQDADPAGGGAGYEGVTDRHGPSRMTTH